MGKKKSVVDRPIEADQTSHEVTFSIRRRPFISVEMETHKEKAKRISNDLSVKKVWCATEVSSESPRKKSWVVFCSLFPVHSGFLRHRVKSLQEA